MYGESILKPIEHFLTDVKGTENKVRALLMKQEVERAIDDINNQIQADAAQEEWLAEQED